MRTFVKLVLIVLWFWTKPNCNGQSTKNITKTPTDSLRSLLPKGYVVFTDAAARLALTNKINAESYFQQLQDSQKLISAKDSTIVQFQTKTVQSSFENSVLRRRNFWKDVEIWGYRIIIIAGTAYVIFRK